MKSEPWIVIKEGTTLKIECPVCGGKAIVSKSWLKKPFVRRPCPYCMFYPMLPDRYLKRLGLDKTNRAHTHR